jgi:hypothetical protein
MEFFGAGAILAILALICLGLVVEGFKGTAWRRFGEVISDLSSCLGAGISALFERHKFVRRVTIFWMFALVTHAHFIVYGIIKQQGTLNGVLPIFGLTVGLVATLTAWYLQVRYHEDKRQ